MGGSFKKIHTHPRVGYAGAPTKRDNDIAKRDDCTGTNFYTGPTAGQSVDSAKKVTFSWNNKCLSPAPEYIDLYLYAPAKNDSGSMIQAFDSAKYAEGSIQTTLNPNWWGLDPTVNLYLQIVEHGSPQFMNSVAVGPLWTATYDSSEAGAAQPSSDKPSVAQRVKNILHALPGGSIAAAVLIPLLVIGSLLTWFYIRRQRTKREAQTNRFSKAVDQRMSTISTDWRSISGAGANAAIRNSMAVRDSVIDGGARPSSVFTNQAGIGALRTSEEPVPQMDEMRRARQSVFTNGERTSRISFAPDVRTSYAEKENPRLPSAVRGLNVRSFHQAQSFDEERPEDMHDRDLAMSPTQAAGPALLHPGEIAARASTDNDADFQREVLQMPAMTLMRTGGVSDTEFVLPATKVTAPLNPAYGSPLPAMPSPALQPHTPMNGAMSGMNSPTGPVLSPDALLRAYAAGRPLASPPPTTPGGGMRILYQNEPAAMAAPQYPQIHQYPATPSIATSTTLAPNDNNPFRKSIAEGGAVRASAYTESMYSAGAYEAYDDEAAYDTEHHHHANTTQYGYGHAQ